MDIDWTYFKIILSASAPGLIVALASSFFAYHMARKQNMSNRLFEKKIEIYMDLLNALHGLKHYYDKKFEDVEFKMRTGNERETLINDNSEECRTKIDEILSIGSIAISKECCDLLNSLNHGLKEAKKQEHYFEYIEHCCAELTEHIRKIITAAKKDLGFW